MFIKMRVQEHFENGIGVCPAVSIGANDPFHLEFPTRLLIILRTHCFWWEQIDYIIIASFKRRMRKKKKKTKAIGKS